MKKYFLTLVILSLLQFAHAQGLKPTLHELVEPPSDKSKLKLFLLVGQSNMAGRGYPESVDTTSNLRVIKLNQNGKWEIAKDPIHFDKPSADGVGPGLQFGKIMAAEDPTVVIGLIPCAVGGSGIDYWKKGMFYPGTMTYPYDDAVARAKAAMANGTLMGILWHQGEADSKPANSEVYEHKLKEVIIAFRKDLGNEKLPFIAGQLPNFQIYKTDKKGQQSIDQSAIKVNEAIAHLSKRISYYNYVTAQNTTHRGDILHFDASSAREMGKRYANEMIKLLGQTQKSN